MRYSIVERRIFLFKFVVSSFTYYINFSLRKRKQALFFFIYSKFSYLCKNKRSNIFLRL